MRRTRAHKPSRLLLLPAELRNQIYRELFADGKVSNLNVIRTCKQVYSEAGIMGFTATTFDIHTSLFDDVDDKFTPRLSHDYKSNIRSVCRHMADHSDLHTFTHMSKHSIQPEQVILIANARYEPWDWASGVRSFNLCGTRVQKIMSAVAHSNPKLREIVFRKDMRSHLKCPRDFANADRQLESYRSEMRICVQVIDQIEYIRVDEKARDAGGLSLIEVSYQVKGEPAARVFTVRWEMLYNGAE